jgi:16S rRNA (adenine1518-N6/adenine1519-N6)-dimethyltransferase
MRRGYSDQNSKSRHGDSQIIQKKSLGQVFLNTDWPVNKVVEQAHDLGIKRVLEIGPGNGILTEALSRDGIVVTAVEKDERFAARMIGLIDSGRLGNIEIVNTDILDFDLAAWINKNSGAPCGVVGNIPYNISTPIIMWLLPHLQQLNGAIFMVQLEFAQRIVAAPDGKDYGSLSVYCQLRANCEFNFKVEKTCFTPIPKVDSAVMTLRPRADDPTPGRLLQYTETICRVAFTQRRKKLRNAVKPFMRGRSEDDCPVDLNRRAETLSPKDFIRLAAFLFEDKI